MKNILLILSSCLIFGCSTTNRQVIVECSSNACSRPTKARVIATMSSTNMTVKTDPYRASKKPNTNVVQTNTTNVVTNSVTTTNAAKTNSVTSTNAAPVITNIPVPVTTNKTVWRDNALYEETTIALVDRYYIIQ